MANIYIGISAEDQTDVDSLKILISRILGSLGHSANFRVYKSQTGIIKNVSAHTKLFFKSQDRVDIAFYVTDKDVKDGGRRMDKIKKKIRSIDPSLLDLCVVAIPDPHFEAWLMADENCVKGVFKFYGPKPIPGKRLKPKTRLKQLYGTSPEIYDPEYKVRMKLAGLLNIRRVERKCYCFKHFVEEAQSKVNNFIDTKH